MMARLVTVDQLPIAAAAAASLVWHVEFTCRFPLLSHVITEAAAKVRLAKHCSWNCEWLVRYLSIDLAGR